MIHDPVTGLAVVVGLGVVCVVVSERLSIPSIITLLAAGLAVGPFFDILDPDELYGELLFPAVSAAVGILLFEGGLSLRWRELGGIGVVLVRLLTVGALTAAVVGSLAAWGVGGLSPGPATLFGVIMVVTGPTVIIPLLRQARLRPRVSGVLRWEGIFVDPIGALLGVVVLEVLVVDDGGVRDAVWAVARATVGGTVIGVAAALLLTWAITHKLIPDHLQNAVALAVVLGSLAGANAVFHEAGLVATTILGVVLANQRRVRIQGIGEFHESIAVLLVPLMFILLAARVGTDELSRNLLHALGVLAVLVAVSRPLSVWTSTIGSSLRSRERAYIAAMAPRGIVAASVSALFGLRLEEHGVDGGADLAALTFLVVAGTVVVYGLAAVPLAKRLRIDAPEPGGVVLAGAPAWAACLGGALSDLGLPVLVVACAEEDLDDVTSRGLLAYSGRLQSEELDDAIKAIGARFALVASHREEVAAFASDRLGRLVGQANLFVVPSDDEDLAERAANPGQHWGHLAFGGRLTLQGARELFASGGECYPMPLDQGEPLTDEVPLVVVSDDGIPAIIDGDTAKVQGTLVVFGSHGGLRRRRPLRAQVRRTRREGRSELS